MRESSMSTNLRACIFDLDGVIVDTAKYHYLSWQRLAEGLGITFTEEDNEQLKGISRTRSLEILLGLGQVSKTAEEKEQLAAQKNEWFREYILQMTPAEVLPGVQDFLDELRNAGIKIALGSASKNAMTILNQVGLTHYFEAIIDGTKVTEAKPDPEIFLTGARALGEEPAHCVVFEDAIAGVEAAHRGGMFCVGVGKANVLTEADIVIEHFTQLNLEQLQQALTIKLV